MTKMFLENGFLTEEGKENLWPVTEALIHFLRSDDVQNMSVQELQILQANLAKMVGDSMSTMIARRNKKDSEL